MGQSRFEPPVDVVELPPGKMWPDGWEGGRCPGCEGFAQHHLQFSSAEPVRGRVECESCDTEQTIVFVEGAE
jgi:hypothetical protein